MKLRLFLLVLLLSVCLVSLNTLYSTIVVSESADFKLSIADRFGLARYLISSGIWFRGVATNVDAHRKFPHKIIVHLTSGQLLLDRTYMNILDKNKNLVFNAGVKDNKDQDLDVYIYMDKQFILERGYSMRDVSKQIEYAFKFTVFNVINNTINNDMASIQSKKLLSELNTKKSFFYEVAEK